MSKLSNALKMIDILSARSVVSVPELADTLEISERGVQRLKDELESVGYSINTVMGPGGGYALEHTSQVHPLAFDISERKLLKQSFSLLLTQDTQVLSKDLSLVLSKLSHQLEGSDIFSVSAFQSIKLNVDVESYQKHLELIQEAIDQHRRIDINYEKNHREKRKYRFEPYELVLVNRFWYVTGYDENNRNLSLKVNRVLDVTLRDDLFRFDEESSSKHMFSDFGYKISPEHVRLEITERDYISEYIWGEKQEITWIDDHRFILDVIFANELAAKDFILQGGSNIKVIEPELLKKWIHEEILKMLKTYQ